MTRRRAPGPRLRHNEVAAQECQRRAGWGSGSSLLMCTLCLRREIVESARPWCASMPTLLGPTCEYLEHSACGVPFASTYRESRSHSGPEAVPGCYLDPRARRLSSLSSDSSRGHEPRHDGPLPIEGAGSGSKQVEDSQGVPPQRLRLAGGGCRPSAGLPAPATRRWPPRSSARSPGTISHGSCAASQGPMRT